jgi:hypothetical protein
MGRMFASGPGSHSTLRTASTAGERCESAKLMKIQLDARQNESRICCSLIYRLIGKQEVRSCGSCAQHEETSLAQFILSMLADVGVVSEATSAVAESECTSREIRANKPEASPRYCRD